MTVNSVTLENFRNIASMELEPHKGVNVIYGENAQGKTNILEAIWLFTGCKSFRGAKDTEFIKFGEEFSKIRLSFNNESRDKNSEIVIGEKKKLIYHNGVPLRSAPELIGSFYGVIFSPLHLSLIKDGPAARRRFLDTAICQLKPSYARNLALYKKAILQRNSILKDISFTHSSALYDVLDSWDTQISSYSARIIDERIKYTELLSGYSEEIYSGISENREKISVEYSRAGSLDKNMSVSDLQAYSLELLKNARNEDLQTKSTSVGPHRDDLEILINSVSARSFGSLGQQRSCALSLKLSESRIIKEITGENPVALLDDVMSVLDERRQDYILNHINDRQVFLTCCEPTQALRLSVGKSFLISGGELK